MHNDVRTYPLVQRVGNGVGKEKRLIMKIKVRKYKDERIMETQ